MVPFPSHTISLAPLDGLKMRRYKIKSETLVNMALHMYRQDTSMEC